MFDFDSRAMKLKTLKLRLAEVSKLFSVNLHLTWNSAHKKKLMSMDFNSESGIQNEVTKEDKSA